MGDQRRKGLRRPAAPTMLRYYYLTWFSQPVADRAVYQTVHPRTFRSILEIGVGNGTRTKRMLELAVKPESHAKEPLVYTGIDLFEARPPQNPGLTLKQAYKELRAEHVQLRLVPGDPLSAIGRMANQLGPIDLVVIAADQDPTTLGEAWRYFPRFLHDQTVVLQEQPTGKGTDTKFTLVATDELHRRAAISARAARRAA